MLMKSILSILLSIVFIVGPAPYAVSEALQVGMEHIDGVIAYIVPCPPFLEWLCGKILAGMAMVVIQMLSSSTMATAPPSDSTRFCSIVKPWFEH